MSCEVDLTRQCFRCGEPFQAAVGAAGGAASWCRPCRNAYNAKYKSDLGLANGRKSSCATCGAGCWGVRCRGCYVADDVKALRERPSRTRAYSKPTNDPRYKALRKQVFAEESTCGFCGEHVDTALKFPNKMSPSLDHIVPTSRGGDWFDRANVRLAHFSCNAKAGRRMQDNEAAIELLTFARAALWLGERLSA